jgi:hypothetical protein
MHGRNRTFGRSLGTGVIGGAVVVTLNENRHACSMIERRDHLGSKMSCNEDLSSGEVLINRFGNSSIVLSQMCLLYKVAGNDGQA